MDADCRLGSLCILLVYRSPFLAVMHIHRITVNRLRGHGQTAHGTGVGPRAGLGRGDHLILMWDQRKLLHCRQRSVDLQELLPTVCGQVERHLLQSHLPHATYGVNGHVRQNIPVPRPAFILSASVKHLKLERNFTDPPDFVSIGGSDILALRVHVYRFDELLAIFVGHQFLHYFHGKKLM